jgi:hypothetical protein
MLMPRCSSREVVRLVLRAWVARLVDVAPTVAKWLGLDLGAVDGRPLEVVPDAPPRSN